MENLLIFMLVANMTLHSLVSLFKWLTGFKSSTYLRQHLRGNQFIILTYKVTLEVVK